MSLLVECLAEQKCFWKSSKRVAVSNSTWERVPGGRSWAMESQQSPISGTFYLTLPYLTLPYREGMLLPSTESTSTEHPISGISKHWSKGVNDDKFRC